MEKQRENLVIFSENDRDREFLARSFREVFEQELTVLPITKKTCCILEKPPRAVIVTRASQEYAAEYFPESELIYADRQVSGHNLEEVIKLPAGTTVLVVNKPEEIAFDTVENLVSMGITHLNFVPYWPGADIDVSRYDIVIYAGFRNYCPWDKKKYIDIGYRTITQSTFVKVIKTYDLPALCVDASHKRYVKLLIDGFYRIQNSLHETRDLKKNFEQVCLLSTRAIINIDHNGMITVFNPAAERMFHLKYSKVIGKSYKDCFSAYMPLISLVTCGKDVADHLLTVGGQKVLISMNVITIERRRYTFLNLMQVEALQGTEEKVRADLYKKGFVAKYHFADIVGESTKITRAKRIAQHYAVCDATVLLTGESGTGKELFAQSIHNSSPRAHAPFVGVNFAAIPENLIESELFGYEEGAFTGASKGGRLGLFRIAHKGSIFLDEIGDISSSMQSRLLRVLEEREIMPVGSSRVIPVDVRIICATNKNLIEMVEQGKFREDLYYRIKVLTLHIPPLRERKEDIPLLISEMLDGGKRTSPFSKSLQQRLMLYDWPGNIRELKALLQYLKLYHGEEEESEEDEFLKTVLDEFLTGPACCIKPATAPHVQEALREDERALLGCIWRCNLENRPAGRYSLARCSALEPYGLTESKLKTKLRHLEECGLLQAGKTRQGVFVTEKAISLLQAEKVTE